MNAQPQDLVTVVQAAKELGISRIAVYQAIQEGRLESVEVLGKIGVPRRALKNYRPNETRVRAGNERAAKSQRGASAKTTKKGKRG